MGHFKDVYIAKNFVVKKTHSDMLFPLITFKNVRKYAFCKTLYMEKF